MNQGTAADRLREQTAQSRSLTDSILSLSSRIVGGTTEWIAASMGVAAGIPTSLVVDAQFAALPFGYIVAPVAIILGGASTLLARKLGPARNRESDERRRIELIALRDRVQLVSDIVYQLPDDTSPPLKEEYHRRLLSTLDKGLDAQDQLFLPPS
jgi:hypothetical protein